MNTLVIYDAKGYLIQAVTGTYRIPEGIPYLELELPDGKRVSTKSDVPAVDITVNPPRVILEDIPLSDIEQLKQKTELQEQALAELTMYISTLGV